MKRYIKVTVNFFTDQYAYDTYLHKAHIISGAEYDVEDTNIGFISDSAFVSIQGTDEEISHFIGYLRMKGLKVEEF